MTLEWKNGKCFNWFVCLIAFFIASCAPECERDNLDLVSNDDIVWGAGFMGITVQNIRGQSKVLISCSKKSTLLLKRLIQLMENPNKYAAIHVILVMQFSGTPDFPFSMSGEGNHWFQMRVEFDEGGKLFYEDRHNLKRRWEEFLFGSERRVDP